MIRDVNDKNLISSLGWVDKGSLWVFENQNDSIEILDISDASYLSLNQGKQNLFSVEHHFEKDHFEITVHSASNPGEVLTKIVIDNGDYSFHGDLTVWNNVSKSYVTYISHNGIKNYWLLLIEAGSREIKFQQFEWFDESYDKGYQGITGVAEVPDTELLLVTIQRDSYPVLYDPNKQSLVRKIKLIGNYGNPKAHFLDTKNQVWAVDYDTIVKLRTSDWSILASKKLQEANNGMSQFIGEFNFDKNEALCVVARPFSGDVIALDTKSLKIRFYCETGSQPLEAVMLEDKRVVARDWQTGNLLTGRMKRKFFG